MKAAILSTLLEAAPAATTAVYFVEGLGLDVPACMRRSGRPMILAIRGVEPDRGARDRRDPVGLCAWVSVLRGRGSGAL